MPRKKRVWYPGAIYHVMSRGNHKASIYHNVSDYIQFLEYLMIIREKYPFKLHGLCLMTNHFHIAIETMDVELWKIMQNLLSIYAKDYNRKYHSTGHLFEGRYTSRLIEDERYFLEVSRYIHLNPVKAQIVQTPLVYDYSSYRMFVQDSDKDDRHVTYGQAEVTALISELIDTERVLGLFGNNSREQYRQFVEGEHSHTEQEMLIQKEMKEDDMWLPY